MNPGLLDCKIMIQRQASGLFLTDAAGNLLTDEAGNQLLTESMRGRFGSLDASFGLWKIRWARKQEKIGTEDTLNGREVGEHVVVYTIRYTPGVTLRDRVVYNSVVYDIISIVELGRRHYQQLNCRALSDTPSR